MRLENKICIITGAAQGIGLATALKFAREGATVIACDMRQYRRLVLEQASPEARAEKIRTMLLLEPNHQGLLDNLKDIESQQISELLEGMRKADRAGKPDEVGRLYQGMQSVAWTNPPAAVVVEEILRIFQKHHSRYLDDKSRQLAAAIAKSHAFQDIPSLTSLMAEWDQVSHQAGITPGEPRARPVEVARQWLARTQAYQEVGMQHEMALSELASALGVENDIKRLFTLYERVLSFKGKLPKGTVLIPPQLEHRFEDVANKLENKNDFNRMLVLVGTISFGVVALVVFLIFVMTR